jgi:5-methylcytosine-specific restriction protein A
MAQWPYGTSTWQRLRRLKLSTSPGCETCKRRGRLVYASVVDHIVPINAGGPAFPSLDGLQALCVQCHNSKTSREQRGEKVLMKGCDVNGLPLDAACVLRRRSPSWDNPLAGRATGAQGARGN